MTPRARQQTPAAAQSRAAVSPDTSSSIDPREFRRTLGRFATGVTVITTVSGATVHGMTANAFMSVSLDPPLVTVAVDHRARMHRLLEETGRYGVSILAENQELLARHFGGRPQVSEEPRFEWQHGLPLIEGAVAHLVCRIVQAVPAGDHTLFIGQVEHLDCRDGAPLLFYGGNYRCLEVQLHDSGAWWW
ncbi:flavin reductase family protein [Thermomicrobiaceae bacterium CFH 74404]|uniref:Flavin reductase family protein n=1 Tax=Thermalbibacter longus TaxID=2951981 RepID=A0AA41W9R1_9BACT|nr:flavin reductase family protein [Thermalbibacter longus]MCM8747821.1 flavin reductase family protein [Thermalbibacter longus]